tara:strand:- start:55 stop:825 length:771 start_codon:yes stop_codon:yes gene_type:complete
MKVITMTKYKTPIILLVGGKGSRYLDENNHPKQLAVIKKKPILIHMMNSYFNNGFNFIILPLGHKKEIFNNFFNSKVNKLKYRFNILNNKFTNFEKNKINIFKFITKKNISKLERVKKSLTYLKDHENIGVNYGDAICNIDIMSVYKKFIKSNLNSIMSITTMKSPFGHVLIKDNIIKEFKEKPDLPFPTNIGYYFFKSDSIKNYNKKNSELETSFLNSQIKKKNLGFYFHKGYFHTVNHKQDLINIKYNEKKTIK